MDFIAPSLVGQKLNLDKENLGTLKLYVIWLQVSGSCLYLCWLLEQPFVIEMPMKNPWCMQTYYETVETCNLFRLEFN